MTLQCGQSFCGTGQCRRGLDPFIKSNGIQQGSFAHNRLCGLVENGETGGSKGHSGKRDVGIFEAGGGIPTGRTVLPNPLTGGSSGDAQFGHEQLQLFEQLLLTSGCLAETLLSWNGSSLRQYSSSRVGTSLEAAAVQVH